MTDFALHHLSTYRAGQAIYESGPAWLPRGHAEVWHDQKRYVYDLRGVRRPAEFRAWVRRVWIDDWNGNKRTLTGRYPNYTVE